MAFLPKTPLFASFGKTGILFPYILDTRLRDFGVSRNTISISFQKSRVPQASSLSKITSRMLVVLFFNYSEILDSR